MRRRNYITLALLVLMIPATATAEPLSAVVAASNGPWIVLAVIGMMRALLCLSTPSCDDDERF